MTLTSAVTHALTTGDLMWDSDGYVALDGELWKDITITATFTYNGGEMGLLPRFQSAQAYVSFRVGNYTASDASILAPTDLKAIATLEAQILGQTYQLGKIDLLSLTIGNNHILTVKINKTNYKAYLDHVLLFNVEYANLVMGTSALYSSAGNSCSIIEALAPIADKWESNIDQVNGSTVQLRDLSNDDTYVLMMNPDAQTDLILKQVIPIDIGGGSYTLSYQYQGEMKASIIEMNGSQAGLSHKLDNTNVSIWVRNTLTVSIASNCTQVTIQFTVSKATPVELNAIQFEKNPFATDYLENTSVTNIVTRGASKITYPADKNIDGSSGAMSMWIQPSVMYTSVLGLKPILFEYGGAADFIRIYYENGQLHFMYGSQTIANQGIDLSSLLQDSWYHIVASWSLSGIALYVNAKANEQKGIYAFSGSSDLIYIGYSSNIAYDIFNGVVDELIIYSKPVTQDVVNDLFTTTDAIKKTDQMLMHSTFDYEISNFEASMMEITPAPLYGSPVIASKDDGTIMNKVSYYDPYTGEYHPYNVEPVVYNGQADFVVVGSKNLETVKFQTMVKDNRGVKIGDPYTIKGDRVYLTLTSDQKKMYRGQTLFVTYQPQDAYITDFNIGVPDSFRVNIGKHDGQGVSVTYEGDKFFVDKLADMIELNPLLSPQHEGFLYMTKTGQPITSFRVKATPSDLLADGFSDAVVMIEPLDALGNFVANANLVVTAMYGFLIPNTDYGSVQLRLTAGRYIYKYRSPLIKYSAMNLPELSESINIIDRDTGLGVQIPITLSLSDSYPNEGYVTLEQQNWEHIAAYVLDKVMENWGKKTSELDPVFATKIDLDGNGTIDLGDIVWLNNYKLTDALNQKYIALVQWYTQHT